VALAIAAVRLGRTQAGLLRMETPGPYRFLLGGPLTFLSSAKLEKLRTQARGLEPSRGVVIDLSDVTAVDASGAEVLVELVGSLLDGGSRVALQGTRPEVREVLLRQEHGGRLEPLFALTESDVVALLQGSVHLSSRDRLVHGVERFRQRRRGRYGPLFDRLAHGQKPHTLFITCSDSRINPNLITSTDPGELFIVRNVGNLVPHSDSPMAAAVSSAIEYAVEVLGVTDVVVCGHSGCGAMRALLGHDSLQGLPGVQHWLREGQSVMEQLPAGASAEEAAKRNALVQLRNALTYPVLHRKYNAGEVRLHAWFFDVGSSELLEWDEPTGTWTPLGTRALPVASAQPLTSARNELVPKRPHLDA
jgi:carbonic anhydrase